MSAIPFMCYNLASSIASTSGDATTSPASNLLTTQPTLVWRSANLTSVALVFSLPVAASVDTLGLLFSNLRSTDTVRWRAGATAAATSGTTPLYDSGLLPAYSGLLSAPHRAKSITSMTTPVAAQFWRVDISAPSHPAGFVSAGNVIIGKRLSMGGAAGGMDWNCEFSWTDLSTVTTTAGYTTVQSFSKLPGWKVTNSWITDADWNTNYNPFFGTVGNSVPVLFVPDPSSAYIQNQAIFGRITSGPWSGSIASLDAWTCDTQIVGLTC